jgi:hypothetical protein
MSKFVCKCGHVISDVRYPSSANATMFTEEALGNFIAKAGRILAELRQAESSGKRETWIKSQVGDGYPNDASDSEVLEDLLSRQLRFVSVSVIQCNCCGRIHIQREPGSNEFTSFAPDID